MSWFNRCLWLLCALVMLTQAFIALQVVYGRINVPVADLSAVVLCGIFGFSLLKRGALRRAAGVVHFVPAGEKTGAVPWLPLVAPWAFGAFVLAGVLSLSSSPLLFESSYFLIRKPIFNYVVYVVGLTGAFLHLRSIRAVYTLSVLFVTVASAVCIGATLPLWQQGYFTAFTPVSYLTVNHKALAVAVAPFVPFLWMGRGQFSSSLGRAAVFATGLALAAVLMTITKTAWITVAFATFGLLRWPLRGGRRLLERPGLMALVVFAATAGMAALPFLLGNRLMADSFDSRMSLNVRAWEMFRQHPIVGYGAGTSTLYEISSFPHYRINGVDAHGVLQKIAPELGLVGLAAYLVFTGLLLRGLWRTAFSPVARPDPLTVGAMTMGLALHVNLLLSTEYFTSSHWAPLAVVLFVALTCEERAAGTTRSPSATVSGGEK